MGGKHGSLKDRLFSRTKSMPGGCIEWMGYRTKTGYGRIGGEDGKTKATHRAAWELVRGEIPAGHFVCHKCDNPACINVEHLFVGTANDNSKDCVAKGRQCRGSTRPASKLTEADIVEIQELHKQGFTSPEIGRRFGVSDQTIYTALSGASYRDVSGTNAIGKLGRARGERTRKNKLGEHDVRSILSLDRQGVKQRHIAAQFGVHRDTIGRIIRGESWSHITRTIRESAE